MPTRTEAFTNSTMNSGAMIPKPVFEQPGQGNFTLTDATRVFIETGQNEIAAIGHYLAARLKAVTGYEFPVQETTGTPTQGHISLTLAGADASLGEEGYQLTVTTESVTLSAYRPAGLFWGAQSLRQLLPVAIEETTPQSGPWVLPAVTIRDVPRFAWRGMMLDVARHFFAMSDIKRLIDALVYYKINRLHLHLSDDQGWRIAIESWPKLTETGGSTETGGGAGGYYSQSDYSDLVAYAQSRYMTIVPEIDMPGHTNAALASYAELNCDGKAPALYTGIEVGFSSLCVDRDVTYRFISDVVREIAARTPGAYFHIGGDETKSTAPADYVKFIERVQPIVEQYGKQMVGWEEIANAKLASGAIVQHWNLQPDALTKAVAQGAKVIMSPAAHAYLDIKYDPSTPLGQDWAGHVSVEAAYEWDPATLVSRVKESDILGVEAALWTETIQTLDDIEFMTFPRVLGIAEIAWSAAEGRSWEEYKGRLAQHGERLSAMGVKFYRAPEVPWGG
ncbi:MAG TPA: beta-N-acetylhexosaminidase [Aggregatilineales bacterium]|nr:beta-N-acetylhexosaminidase [Aggregatilineales bacterium]